MYNVISLFIILKKWKGMLMFLIVELLLLLPFVSNFFKQALWNFCVLEAYS